VVSLRRLPRGLRALAVGVVVGVLVAPGAHAQAAVRGKITLLERAGAAAHDVEDAVVYLESATRPPKDVRDAHATGEIDMRHREFEPHVQIVRVGGTVSFPNSDPFSHNVFSNSALGAFDLGLYRSGVTRGFTFPRAGVYAIYCNIHARMVSFVVAVTTPWVTQVGADGQFSIPAVPAGTYRLHAWHERAPEVVQELVVSPTGTSVVTLSLDARGYVAKPHPNKFGAPYPLTRADRY
jgi:plastocyanin